jgi:hypothetical protein
VKKPNKEAFWGKKKCGKEASSSLAEKDEREELDDSTRANTREHIHIILSFATSLSLRTRTRNK